MRRRKTAAAAPSLGGCSKHAFERAISACSSCHRVFCEECVIFPLGKKRPLCVACAVVAAGLRRNPRMAPF